MIRYFVVIVGSVVLLTFLLLQSRMNEPEIYYTILNDLRLVKQISAKLNKDILRVQAGLLQHYDPVVDSVKNIRATLDLIEKRGQEMGGTMIFSPGFITGKREQYVAVNTEIEGYLESYRVQVKKRESMIERFKSRNATLKNSTSISPVLAGEMAEYFASSVQQENAAGLVWELKYEILLYNLTRREELKQSIFPKIETLMTMQNFVEDPEAKNLLGSMLRHSHIALTQQEEVSMIINRLMETDGSNIADKLYAVYGERQDILNREAKIYMFILFCVSLLLSFYLIYVLVKLRNTATKLEHLNDNLEHEVEQRTKELHASRERFELAVRGSLNGIWDWNIDTGEYYFSERFKELLGYEDNEIKNDLEEFTSRLHPEDHDLVMDSFKKHLKTKAPYDVQYRLKTKPGQYRWYRSKGQAIWNDDGHAFRMAGSISDITYRKEAEEELRSTRERFELAVRGSLNGIWDWNIDTGEYYFSERFKELLGYEDNEIKNDLEEFTSRLHPDDYNFVMGAFRRHLKEKKPYDVQYRLKTKLGGYRWYRSKGQALWNNDGHAFRMAGSISDITYRKEAEAELHQAKEQAEAASKAKSNFLANMSHEIRTPMNGIIGMTNMLYDTDLTEEQKECANIIKQSGESLLEIINDILDLSKIEAGKFNLEPASFDVRSTVEEVLGLLAPVAEDKGIKLMFRNDGDDPYIFNADQGRIRQILVNLVGNAIKFTDVGHVLIQLECSEKSDKEATLLFKIQDTGMGIPEDKLDYIFNKFSQADESSVRKFGGTGLGLAICKRLVKMMNGEVGVESELGKGSTFWFKLSLPYGDAKRESRKQEQKNGLEKSCYDARVLVVEDNEVNQVVVTRMLRKLGCHVDIARNGREAIEKLAEIEYDIVFMDMQMPEMDGLEATKQIRAMDNERSKANIVALTANALQGDREKCLDAGMNDYLAKPVRLEELEEKLSLYAAK